MFTCVCFCVLLQKKLLIKFQHKQISFMIDISVTYADRVVVVAVVDVVLMFLFFFFFFSAYELWAGQVGWQS